MLLSNSCLCGQCYVADSIWTMLCRWYYVNNVTIMILCRQCYVNDAIWTMLCWWYYVDNVMLKILCGQCKIDDTVWTVMLILCRQCYVDDTMCTMLCWWCYACNICWWYYVDNVTYKQCADYIVWTIFCWWYYVDNVMFIILKMAMIVAWLWPLFHNLLSKRYKYYITALCDPPLFLCLLAPCVVFMQCGRVRTEWGGVGGQCS